MILKHHPMFNIQIIINTLNKNNALKMTTTTTTKNLRRNSNTLYFLTNRYANNTSFFLNLENKFQLVYLFPQRSFDIFYSVYFFF